MGFLVQMTLLAGLPFELLPFQFLEPGAEMAETDENGGTDFLTILLAESAPQPALQIEPESLEPEQPRRPEEMAMLPFVAVVPQQVPNPLPLPLPRLEFGLEPDTAAAVECAPETPELPLPVRPRAEVALEISWEAPPAKEPEGVEPSEQAEPLEPIEAAKRPIPTGDSEAEPKRRERREAPAVERAERAEPVFRSEMKPAAAQPDAPTERLAAQPAKDPAPVARSAPVTPAPEPARTPVVREIAIRLPGVQESRPVDVHLSERRGKVQVEVVTTDERLATSLRDNVSDLVDRLRTNGYAPRPEAARPEAARGTEERLPASAPIAGERMEQQENRVTVSKEQPSGDGSNSQHGQHHQGHPRGNRSRWIEEFLRNAQTESEGQEGETYDGD